MHKSTAHETATDAADQSAKHHDDEGKLHEVPSHLAGRVTQSLELCDLLTLEADQAGEQRIDHECGYAEKDNRISERECVEHSQFVIEPHGRAVISASVGTGGTVT